MISIKQTAPKTQESHHQYISVPPSIGEVSPDIYSVKMNHSRMSNFTSATSVANAARFDEMMSNIHDISRSIHNNSTCPPATPSVPVDENRKPKHLSQWSNADVIKWLKRHCEHFYEQYGDLFLEHQITGQTLCRVTDNMLERMGIELQDHRDELRRIVMKLKLKSDMVRLKDLGRSC